MFLKHTKWAFMWGLVILILCGIPGKDLPKVSFLELLNFDKFVHASLFFILVLLSTRGFSLQTAISVFHQFPKTSAFIVCVIYGGIIELLQGAFFEDRTADVLDFIANSFGCLVGCMLYVKAEKKVLIKLIH